MTAKDLWNVAEAEIVIVLEEDGIRYYTNNSYFYELLRSDREVVSIKIERNLDRQNMMVIEV